MASVRAITEHVWRSAEGSGMRSRCAALTAREPTAQHRSVLVARADGPPACRDPQPCPQAGSTSVREEDTGARGGAGAERSAAPRMRP